MTVLIDSDILIEVTRGRDSEVIRRWSHLADSPDLVLCSTVSVAELWHGALPREHKLLNDLFDRLICVPVDLQTGRKAGEFLHKYRKSHRLELGDALIAAAAILKGAFLWTRNRKRYPMAAVSFF